MVEWVSRVLLRTAIVHAMVLQLTGCCGSLQGLSLDLRSELTFIITRSAGIKRLSVHDSR